MNIKNIFLVSICLFSSLASVNSIRAVDRINRSNILFAGVDGGSGGVPRPNISSSSFEIIRPQSICNDRQGGGGWNIGGVSGSGPRPT